MTNRSVNTGVPQTNFQRIASVDFFRGLTMFLLIGEASLIYEHFIEVENNPVLYFLGTQLSHHEWHGLHFWDLIQPYFMFIVGVSIPFAIAARKKKGDSDALILQHAIKRSLLLLFFGWALYCIGPGKIVWRFQNVLAQLSVTYLVAFLIRNKSVIFQLVLTLIILLFTDLAYRYFPVEGFNQPWVPFHNLGAWVNNMIQRGETPAIWASLNAIPTIAHTVWGVLFGKLLMSDQSNRQKIKIMIVVGLSALIIGYGLDWLNITPIIKKIATASFVFASGGWTILSLCFCYWLIDVKKLFRDQAQFFIIVGMNSIFIYLFFEVGTAGLLNKIFLPFTNLLFSWTGELNAQIFNSAVSWMAMWYLCYWLYKKRIFFKI